MLNYYNQASRQINELINEWHSLIITKLQSQHLEHKITILEMQPITAICVHRNYHDK